MEKYVIEGIQKVPPYFSFGYVKSFDDDDIQWTRDYSKAMQAPIDELKDIAKAMEKKYNGNEYAYLMAWFFKVENGKLANKRTFVEGFK